MTNRPSRRNLQFTLSQAAMLPLLGFKSIETEKIGDDVHIIRATVQNSGFLPTTGSRMASRLSHPPMTVEITGAEVLVGRKKSEIDHLEGRESAITGRTRPGQFKADNERLVELVVRGSGPVTLTVESYRAGKI